MKKFMTCAHEHCYAGDHIKEYKAGGPYGKYGGHRKAYKSLVGKPERLRKFGRSKNTRDYNFKVELKNSWVES